MSRTCMGRNYNNGNSSGESFILQPEASSADDVCSDNYVKYICQGKFYYLY